MIFKKIKIKPDRKDWLDQRNIGIGGSDSGTVCGMNPYSSPYALWAHKTGRLQDDFQGNEATRLGLDLEDYVSIRFVEKTGKKVRRSGYMFQSVEHPFMIANVDRLVVGENAGLECKTMSPKNSCDLESGEIPDQYYVQCQHYMAVLGADKWYLAILKFQEGFYVFEIERNQAEIDSLIDIERDFWKHVEEDSPPEIDGSKHTAKALDGINPPYGSASDPSLVDSNISLFDQIYSLKVQIKDMNAQKKTLENRVREMMGSCTKCRSEAYSVSYAPGSVRSVDYEKLASEYPEAFSQCVMSTETRKLVIRKKAR